MVWTVTADHIFRQGLHLVGFSAARFENVNRAANLTRFRAHYGSNPIVYAQIWEDLQTTTIPEARIDSVNAGDLALFLMSIHFLRCYTTEAQLAATFRVCERTARKWCWKYASKIQALKHEKIVWPTRWTPGHVDFVNDDVPVFLVTVDGVHCRVHEPMHPTKSKDKSYFSHKFKRSALNYELGISVYDNALVWLNGPTKASQHDITIFRSPNGLKDTIPAGKRVIADRGYCSKRDVAVISTPNSHDPAELRKFKSRARARHESFNGKIKTFKCLAETFRHELEHHKIAFEAVCVICQYQLENGSPLFDV